MAVVHPCFFDNIRFLWCLHAGLDEVEERCAGGYTFAECACKRYRDERSADSLAKRSFRQLMYIGYWVVMLCALMNSLGKSEEVTDELQENKAAKVKLHISQQPAPHSLTASSYSSYTQAVY